MSILALHSPRFLRSCVRSASLAPRLSARTFHPSSRRSAFSENDHHKHDEDRKAEIDSHKHDSLGKQKIGKPEWKQQLASSSEAAVKADRDEVDSSEEAIKKLQNETQGLADKQHK